jgi:hypothetical protein
MQRNVLAIGCVTLALASCGGSGGAGAGKSGGSGSGADAGSFGARANAVCKQAKARAADVGGKGLGAAINSAVTYQSTKAAGLRALAPPDNMQDQYAKYLAVIAARRALLTRFGATHPTKATRAYLTQETKLQTREERLAAALGLKGCI